MIHLKKEEEYRSGFEELLRDLDLGLKNSDKPQTVDQWSGLEGKNYEVEIFERLKSLSAGSCFENSFEIVSGQKFPDIVARCVNGKWGFGVEAKTTKKDHWKSTGSSIVESTRVSDIDRIYLSFAKLGGIPDFLTRPYEECMSGVAVTHSPRYTIDMLLTESESIFSKIDVPYDRIRSLDRPFDPFKLYYTKDKGPDKVLWWADAEGEASPPVLRVWSEVSKEEKQILRLQAYLRFPEVIKASGNTKYNRTTLWLASSQAIIPSCLRDLFSAGGRKKSCFIGSEGVLLPASVYRFFESISSEESLVATALPAHFNVHVWVSEVENSIGSYSESEAKPMKATFLRILENLEKNKIFC